MFLTRLGDLLEGAMHGQLPHPEQLDALERPPGVTRQEFHAVLLDVSRRLALLGASLAYIPTKQAARAVEQDYLEALGPGWTPEVSDDPTSHTSPAVRFYPTSGDAA